MLEKTATVHTELAALKQQEQQQGPQHTQQAGSSARSGSSGGRGSRGTMEGANAADKLKRALANAEKSAARELLQLRQACIHPQMTLYWRQLGTELQLGQVSIASGCTWCSDRCQLTSGVCMNDLGAQV